MKMSTPLQAEELGVIQTLIDTKEVIWGSVVQITNLSKTEQDLFIAVPKHTVLSKNHVKITRIEADTNFTKGSLTRLLDKKVPFVITHVEDGIIYGSRRIAQDILKEALMPRLKDGSTLRGTITGWAGTGAWIEVDGVAGLLRTRNYSIDHSEIKEMYALGDKIDVRCHSINDMGKIEWEVIQKVSRSAPLVCNFDVGAVMVSTVTSLATIKGSSFVFVRLEETFIDAICWMPEQAVAVGDKVSVIISSIEPPLEEFACPRVRARILRQL